MPPRASSLGRPAGLACLALATILAGGCRQDMHDQPVLEPYEASDFFSDGRADRAPIDGTVARGQLSEDRAYFTGLDGDAFVTALPVPVTRTLLERGRERYEIFCSPCHDRLGAGQGMIVRRGFKQPASFHEARLREQPAGYYFDVMTRGFGDMSNYAAQISAADRWAIAAYIRVLQRSQRVEVNRLPAALRSHVLAGLETPPAAGGAPQEGHDD